MTHVPDEVRNAACCWAIETGHWPKWFTDLQSGTHRGAVPSVPHERIAEYRAAIRRRLAEATGSRMSDGPVTP